MKLMREIELNRNIKIRVPRYWCAKIGHLCRSPQGLCMLEQVPLSSLAKQFNLAEQIGMTCSEYPQFSCWSSSQACPHVSGDKILLYLNIVRTCDLCDDTILSSMSIV